MTAQPDQTGYGCSGAFRYARGDDAARHGPQTGRKVMAGMFEVFVDEASSFRFRLKAPDGAILAVSAAFNTKSAAVAGIAAVRECAGMGLITDLCPAGMVQTPAAAAVPRFNSKAHPSPRKPADVFHPRARTDLRRVQQRPPGGPGQRESPPDPGHRVRSARWRGHNIFQDCPVEEPDLARCLEEHRNHRRAWVLRGFIISGAPPCLRAMVPT